MTLGGSLRRLIEIALGRVLPWMGAGYVRFVMRTTRWTWIGQDMLDAVVASRKPFIAAFWHGRILMMVSLMERTDLTIKVVISANRDGELIARTIRYFGGDTIRGSTRDPRKKRRNKGGAMVARSARDHLESGGILAITPDGPRGPLMQAQSGVAAISAQTGVPVVPFAYSMRFGRVLRSWDKFLFPLPFGKGAYVIGDGIAPPANTDDASIEAHRLRIQQALVEVTAQADRAIGRAPTLPG